MKLKYFSLLFSFFGILFLYILSKISQPIFIEIAEMEKYDGREVTVRGIIKEYNVNRFGNQIITIFDKNQTAEIYIEGITDVEYGDKIQVTGTVEKYQKKIELVVSDTRQVKLLKKWQNITIPLRQIAQNPTKYIGLNVNVSGFVEFISNDNFYIVDLENKHSILVEYLNYRDVAIYPGQRINVFGKLIFDEKNFRYKLKVFEEIHSIIQTNKE
jgi:DNA/RNA endonuclease YhcR with UshA esterase domain